MEDLLSVMVPWKEEESSVASELYQSVQAFLTMLDAKEEVVLVEFYAQNYVMVAKSNAEQMYSIWQCKGKDKSGEEYLFVRSTSGYHPFCRQPKSV